jgi:hypothetical protein
VARPGEVVARPGEVVARPGEVVARPGEVVARPAAVGATLCDSLCKPDNTTSRPREERFVHGQAVTRSECAGSEKVQIIKNSFSSEEFPEPCVERRERTARRFSSSHTGQTMTPSRLPDGVRASYRDRPLTERGNAMSTRTVRRRFHVQMNLNTVDDQWQRGSGSRSGAERTRPRRSPRRRSRCGEEVFGAGA